MFLPKTLVAANLEAEKLIILTAVDYVYLNFNQENQRALKNLTVKEAKKFISEKQFSVGSMLPKVQACLSFVEGHPEREAIITSLKGLDDALKGKLGTVVIDQ
ncbi:hypothetical protein IV81_GL000068 [Pediococcus stilesii]|uniref:carbamate kinase n=1 Tax=Pediococcus stilesii TaxID=331679 RepID=A0A0R2L0H5_9LACO|nr:hypothetical protein IV81_GL000068 [Pediococcus stilesii]